MRPRTPESRMLAALAASTVLYGGAVSGSAAQEPDAEPLAIVGASVIPMDTPRVLRDQTVLIGDGVVRAVGPRTAVDVPSGARILDGSGLFVVPGLHDMHVHLGEVDADVHLKLYLANGVTTIQSMHGSPWHLELRRRLADGELGGARMFTTGPTTARVGITTPEEARALVREQKAAGYDAIKQYGSGRGPLTRETYHALIDEARRQGIRVVGHAPRTLPFAAVLEEGQHSIDHMEEVVYTSVAIGEVFGPYLDVQFGRARVESYPEALERLPDNRELQPVLERLAREARAAGLAVTPTLVAFDMIQAVTTDRIYELVDAPEMEYVHPFTRVQWSPAFNRYRTGGWRRKLDLMSRILERSHELQMRLTAVFHDAGVPIMAGTDAPLVFVFPGESLHRELALLVESGLEPYAALEAATVVPARFLGTGTEAGTVAAGNRADLVLLEANPLDDISNTRRIAGVVRGGEWFPRERLDAMKAEIAMVYRPLEERIAPITRALVEGEAEEALERYADLGASELATFVERAVNSLGYRLLRSGDVDEAVRVFEANAEYFPDAFNTWDSLAEAHMVRGDDELAIHYYEKSLELNPANGNALRMIERIRERSEGS